MRDVSRYPNLSMREAGSVFGWGRDKFIEVWEEGLKDEIRSVEKINGRKLLAEDVFRAAYPTATKHTIQTFVRDFMEKRMEERERALKKRRNRDREGA